MDLVDTHCHIDLDAFDADRDAVIGRAREAGVRRMVLVAFAPERWRPCFDLAAAYDGMFVAVGLHPTEAERYNDALESELRALAANRAVVAIGETGIDHHWETAAPAVQRAAFARQIALAKALGLPFIIHQRDAADDVLEVLREAEPPHRGVMHCFTGDAAYAEACLDLGLHIGLGGAITRRKARRLRADLEALVESSQKKTPPHLGSVTLKRRGSTTCWSIRIRFCG